MRRAALALAVVVATAILAAPCFAFDDVFQQTFPLPPGGNFELQNVNGSVHVSGWDRNEVQIHAVKSARRDPRDLRRVQIEVQARPDSVAVATRYPHDDGVEVYVEYRVRVPRRVLLRHVGTVNGSVHVSGVEATGELRSVNGNVEVLDGSGRWNARTTNGNVHLELRQVDPSGPLAAETVNGSIVLALPPDTGAELDVRNVNGDFQSELPLTLQGSLTSREFHGRLGAGGSPIRMRTVNGAIRVVSLRPVV
jgi:hypothetical protein